MVTVLDFEVVSDKHKIVEICTSGNNAYKYFFSIPTPYKLKNLKEIICHKVLSSFVVLSLRSCYMSIPLSHFIKQFLLKTLGPSSYYSK
jgi:hypothetical protein